MKQEEKRSNEIEVLDESKLLDESKQLDKTKEIKAPLGHEDTEMSEETRKHFYLKLFSIALPLALQNLVTSSLNLVDVFMISSLSTASIAGVSLANKMFFLLFLLLFGISSGSAILTAQYWGIKDINNIRRVLGVCLGLGVAGAAFFTFAVIGFPTQVMRIFTTEQGAIVEGAKYLRIVGICYIPTAITFSYVFILRSTGKTKLPMYVSIAALILNTILNYTLIYGNFGAPEMGVEGAAVATVISRSLEFGILIYVIYKRREVPAAKLNELFDWTRAFISKYFTTVTPVIINELIWAYGVTMYDLVYGRMGEVVTATMGITKTVEQIGFFLIFSIGNAAGVLLGNQMGTGDFTQVFNYAKKLIKLVLGVGIVMGTLVFLASGPVSTLFRVEPEVSYYIALTLKVMAFATVVKGLNMLIIVGILRSGGDTKFCMYLDGGAVWFVAVPLVALSGLVWGLPVQYVYALSMSEEIVKLVIGLWRTYSKKWINNIIAENE